MTKKKEEYKKESQDSRDANNLSTNTAEQEELAIEEQGAGTGQASELESKLTELTAALAAANDKYLRLSAEFDNFRKRTLKEKMELMKNASESVMVSFLPIIDDVERAMQAIETSDNLDNTKEGISLIYNKFKDFTRQNGVVEMEAKGLALNTDQHEAITTIPAPADELKGKIVDVIQKGYLLNEKVIRYAKVVVGE